MNKKSLVLIIDDEPDIRQLLNISLTRMGLECMLAKDLHGAYTLLKKHQFYLCLVDMRLPDGDGLDLVDYTHTHYPQLTTIVITAHGNMNSAIQALKFGAFDFLSKPVDLDVLRNLISNALKLKHTAVTNHVDQETAINQLIGKSSVMVQIRKTITKLNRSQAPVYISGESGTGKELVAHIIHQQSARRSAPFIAVNCGAIPTELMENELFGHTKGSFTGAVTDNKGLFRAAEGGTLFLDEIAELPLHMQVKLLRAIQEKSIRPIGSNKEIAVDTRILSATHRELSTLVKQGKFRQDLFYRINVIEIAIPPLRQRKEDIPLLVNHKLAQLLKQQKPNNMMNISLSANAMNALSCYAFPGNIRELENILERAITFCEGGIIDTDDLSLPVHQGTIADKKEQYPLDSYLTEVEQQTILEALEKVRWNKTAAAKLLGISFRALRYRLKKLGINK